MQDHGSCGRGWGRWGRWGRWGLLSGLGRDAASVSGDFPCHVGHRATGGDRGLVMPPPYPCLSCPVVVRARWCGGGG